jgi:hypothetical protein
LPWVLGTLAGMDIRVYQSKVLACTVLLSVAATVGTRTYSQEGDLYLKEGYLYAKEDSESLSSFFPSLRISSFVAELPHLFYEGSSP